MDLSEFYRTRGATRPGTQNLDGTPHLTYYIADDQLSFVWSGISSEPTEVCFGGYGEPVFAEFKMPIGVIQMESLLAFKIFCDEWADNNRETIEGWKGNS